MGEDTRQSMAPLAGLTVLDLTHMLSGPYGSMLLADLGACTIKVEPLGGEGTRRLLADDPLYSRDGVGAYFLTLNRNKESVAIDLKHPAGLQVFMDCVRRVDAVIDNFAAGVTRRLGIHHEALAKINPRIVTCSITGFGETGPQRDRPAFDQVVQAMGGGMSITGDVDGMPTRSGIPIGDLGGGVFAALGVLAALQARGSNGGGRHVDVSMLDVQVSLLNYMATMYLMSGVVPQRIGNGHFVHVPYNRYASADGHLIVACIGDPFFARLVEVLDVPELRAPEFATQPGRYAAKEFIDEVVGRELRRHGNAHWLERLAQARIPCGPVNDFAQALADPQILARDMVVEVALNNGDRLRMPGNPVKIDGWQAAAPTPPPGLGEHTSRVMQTLLGYGPERIAALRAQGAIA